MNETNASITVSKDGYTEENMFFTYSNEEMEQNIINRETAESVYAPKFIPYYPALVREYNLSKTEAIIYGFIDFFTSVNSHKFYFTNEQIAKIADCSIDTASKAIIQLGKHGLISISRTVRAGGGQIRFVKPKVLDSGKSLVASKEKHRTNNNKINNNKINIYTPISLKEENKLQGCTSTDLYQKYITKFNTIVGSSFKGDAKSQRSFQARLKKYTTKDIVKATVLASKDKHLMGANDSGKRYLTPEYILREDKLEKWLNSESDKGGSGFNLLN